MKSLEIKFRILLYGVCLFTLSCTSYPPEIKHSLEIAGENRNELIKVLDHYDQKPEDSLKLKAAIYLIKNMEGLYSLDTTSVVDNEPYFNCLDTMYRRIEEKPPFDFITKTLDDYIQYNHISPKPPYFTYKEDLKTVKAQFLIENIDYAFRVWKSKPWSKQMSFDLFCEYILPYRSTDTFMDNFREYFIHKYSWIGDSIKGNQDCFRVEKVVTNEIKTWFNEDGTLLLKYPFLNPMKFFDIIKGRIGNCQQTNALKADALRALGVPVGMEFVPQWGNHNSSHSFYKVLDSKHDTIKKRLTNMNLPLNTAYIISGTNVSDVFASTDDLPPFIMPFYNRTVPKVYRNCFSRQPQSLAALNVSNEEIPDLFNDEHLLDVTGQYLETADVELNIASKKTSQYAYLCVFNIAGWRPIAWSRIMGGKARFKNMGKNIVYLPAFFKNGKTIPYGSPFLLEQNGSVKKINKSKNTQTVFLWRKYPYSIYLAEWASYMIGAKFQGANNFALSGSKTFYTINILPYGMQEIPVHDNKKYRYLIYRFDGMKMTFPAEIEFYGIVNGKEVKLSGREIGNKGRYGFTSSALWDGNRGTYYYNDDSQPQTFVGLDLGKGKECAVTRIRFCPRSDTNDILPGEHYELFYWNGKWVSLGNQKGRDMKPLVYNNVPKHALFWLHAGSGNEERIFTYENGKQIWW